MRTLAHSLVERRYVEQGKTTRIVVVPHRESGLPDSLIEAAQPVPLDLLAGRPVNLELDDQGLSADICFAGPPVRCSFPWESVVAVQDGSGSLVQTLIVTVATVMEDRSVRPVAQEHLLELVIRDGDPADADRSGPAMEVLSGGGRKDTEQRAKRRPKLAVVEGAPEPTSTAKRGSEELP